jgi:hypothetical protein
MKALESSFSALKELITIIMCIAIGNIMIESFKHMFMTNKSSKPLLGLNIINIDYLLLGFSLTLLAARFYHGNIRTLDEAAEMQCKIDENSSLGRFFDFVAIIIQGSIFSGIGIILGNRDALFITLLSLLFSDIMLVATGFMAFGKLTIERNRWVFINIFSIIMLIAVELFNLPFMISVYLTLIVGSVIDYLLNWSFYFPNINNKLE